MIELFFILIAAVIISNVLSSIIKKIPISLIQIVLGLIIAFVFHPQIVLENEWFLLLFIAPLLFNDAWRFPKEELWSLRAPIFGNAIILVFVTTIFGGYLIHLLVPSLSLMTSIALAAVISPTDPIAVTAIGRYIHLPKNIVTVLEGESLINDASGLVAFNFAIRAAIFGTFSFVDAIGSFIYMFIGGILAGYIIMIVIDFIRDKWRGIQGEDIFLHVLITLGVPFLVYFISEDLLHVSGLVAVVSAGIVSSVHNDGNNDRSMKSTVTASTVWDLFSYGVSAIIFVMLGIELPSAMESVILSNLSTPLAFFYGFVTWLIVFIIRIIWSHINQIITYTRTKDIDQKPSFRLSLISGISGVRGAITLAGVLSVSAIGTAGFPGQDLMVFIAAEVVVTSLIVASIFLPILTKTNIDASVISNEVEDNIDGFHDERKAQEADHLTTTQATKVMYQSNIALLRSYESKILKKKHQQNIDLDLLVIYDLLQENQTKLRTLLINSKQKDLTNEIAAESELSQIAIDAEEDAAKNLLAQKKISSFTYNNVMRELSKQRRTLSLYQQRSLTFNVLTQTFSRLLFVIRRWFSSQQNEQTSKEIRLALNKGTKAAIKQLEKEVSYTPTRGKNANAIRHRVGIELITKYRTRLSTEKINQNDYDNLLMEYQIFLINNEREIIQKFYEENRLSRKNSLTILESINFSELSILQAEHD